MAAEQQCRGRSRRTAVREGGQTGSAATPSPGESIFGVEVGGGSASSAAHGEVRLPKVGGRSIRRRGSELAWLERCPRSQGSLRRRRRVRSATGGSCRWTSGHGRKGNRRTTDDFAHLFMATCHSGTAWSGNAWRCTGWPYRWHDDMRSRGGRRAQDADGECEMGKYLPSALGG
jgi:hypothetical protein